MAVSDRWHKTPAPGDEPCKCGRGKNKLYPSSVHEQGDRWQVRYRDPAGKQRKRNFAVRDGSNPNIHADAYDKLKQGQLVTGSYTDPAAGNVTLREYAEKWRATRTHGESAATGLETRLRLHVYEDRCKPGSERTPRGGVSIGQHPMGLLRQRPSLIAAWVAAMPLASSSRRLVIGDVSAVFQAAIEDGIVGSDPTKSKSVARPGPTASSAQPFTAAELAGIAAEMPGRFRILPVIGAVTGARRMEMCALGADDIVRGKAPKVRVQRQLKMVDGELRFGPVKNRKPHDVPVPQAFIDDLDAHLERFPPPSVALPWHEPGSKLHGTTVTVRLILSMEDGTPVTRNDTEVIWPRAVRAHLAKSRRTVGRQPRSVAGFGIHRTRHTAASSWLRSGIDLVRTAAWLGDTVAIVASTYAHLMPDDHSGDEAGRAASAAFLGACALNVPHGEGNAASAQAEAV